MEEYVAKNIARASTSKSAKSRIAALERMDRIEKPVIWEKKSSLPLYLRRTAGQGCLPRGRHEHRCRGGRKPQGPLSEHEAGCDREEGEDRHHRPERCREILPAQGHPGDDSGWKQGTLSGERRVKISDDEQENRQLHPDKTAINEIWDRFPSMYEVEVRNILGRWAALRRRRLQTRWAACPAVQRAQVAFAIIDAGARQRADFGRTQRTTWISGARRCWRTRWRNSMEPSSWFRTTGTMLSRHPDQNHRDDPLRL